MALPILQLGSQDPFVTKLRERLTALGADAGAGVTAMPDVFDSALDTAVRAFQAKVGLAADGVVGPDTWAKLGADAGAGAGVPVTDSGSWLRLIGLAAALYFGYRWWKGRKATGEFQHRLAEYGDATDDRLIEEPLLLMERGDCSGAARMLIKRRSFYRGRGGAASSPKNAKLFQRVAQKIIAHCPREVTEQVEDAMEESREYETASGIRSTWDRDQSRMRAKRGDKPQWWNEPRGADEDAKQRSLPFLRRGARPFPRSGSELRPHTGSGSKVVYVDARGNEHTATVKRESGDVVLVTTVGGNAQTIRRADVVRWLPKFQRDRAPNKAYTPEQKARNAAAMTKLREKRREAKQIENDLKRRGVHLTRGRDVVVRPKFPRGDD